MYRAKKTGVSAMRRLEGKEAVVTAAAQGIGRATALAFAAEGARVVATDINEAGLNSLAAEARVETRHVDVRSDVSIAGLVETIAAPDILFNCAGLVHHGTVLDCEETDWDVSFDLNVKSVYRMLRAFLPGMRTGGGGSIINMSSIVSSVLGAPNRFAYGATKAAIIGITKSIATDFVEDGIRCNAICPATVQTPSLDDRINAFDDPVAARADFVARQPMGRLGRVEEIAALAVYLASDESAYTTGAAHLIDGGWAVS